MIGHFQSNWIVKICKSVNYLIMIKTKYTSRFYAIVLNDYTGNDGIVCINKNKTPAGEIIR